MRARPCSVRTREQCARHSRDRKETSKTRARCESRGRRPSSAELHHRSAVAPTWCTFMVFAARLRGLPAREHSLERVPVDSKDPGCLALVAFDTLHDAEHDLTLELLRRLLERQLLRPADLEAVLGQEDVKGQVVELYHGPFSEDYAPLDHVLKFTDVARPTILLEGGQGVARKAVHSLAELAAVAADEVVHEQRHVRDPLGERRYLDRHDVQSIVQVFAEGPAPYRLLEVHVRCRHDTHVDLDGPRAAHPLDLALLEHA